MHEFTVECNNNNDNNFLIGNFAKAIKTFQKIQFLYYWKSTLIYVKKSPFLLDKHVSLADFMKVKPLKVFYEWKYSERYFSLWTLFIKWKCHIYILM